MGRGKKSLIPDQYGRRCVDCGEPLHLIYEGPLADSQALVKLTDSAEDWIEEYAESGGSLEGEDAEENNALYEFLLAVQKLDSLNVRTLPKEFESEFEEAKRRGFFTFIGSHAKAGTYVLDCFNRHCPGHNMGRNKTQPRDPDQRGKRININDDGTQDKFEKLIPNRTISREIEGSCPSCGTPSLVKSHSRAGEIIYICDECHKHYRVKDTGKGYDRDFGF